MQWHVDTTLPVLSPNPAEVADAARSTWPLEVDAFGVTDMGRVRARNEDQFLVAELDRQMLIRTSSVESTAPTRWRCQRQAMLLAVADGMGGHAGGGMASQVVIDALAGYLLKNLPWAGDLDEAALHAADQEARRALVHCQARLTEVADRKGMLGGQPGTTLTAAYVSWPQLLVLHVGDSRLYLLRGGRLTQLTTDHTFFTDPDQHMKRSETSPMRHVLTNAIIGGPERDAFGEVRRVELEPDDRLLVCTDGLTEHVPDDQLAAIIGAHDTMRGACEELVRAASEAGGSDNITAVVARFVPVE
jgi:protein phosphatase